VLSLSCFLSLYGYILINYLYVIYTYIFSIFRGVTWTAARNAPGSFALFGGSAIVKESIFKLDNYNKATFFQNFVASVGGAIASITVSAPVSF